MSVTITITDNGDGTGGVATIAGGGAGDANALYYTAFNGSNQSYTMALAGSRTGNGTIPFSLGVGAYVFSLLAAGAQGPIAAASITDADDSISLFKRIADAARSRLALMNLIPIGRIFVKEVPRLTEVELSGVTFPAVWLCGAGVEKYLDSLNNKDDIEYPIVVIIVGKQNTGAWNDDVKNLRFRISKALRHQARTLGLETVYDCVPIPDVIVDPKHLMKNLNVSVIGFGFRSRETRGLTA